MQIDTLVFCDDWKHVKQGISDPGKAALVFLFGDSDTLKQEGSLNGIQALYPNANIVGASSAGHILGTEINTCPIVATAVYFEKGSIKTAAIDFEVDDDIEVVSANLLQQLPKAGLRHIFVLSEGLFINGSDLVRGLNRYFGDIPITGGMAGDGDRFQETWTVANAQARQKRIVAIGFYGDDFVISHGCCAGWSEFGADRLITKSKGNVLYELDNEPALDLYKKYLGEFAADLPNSGMRFPLSIKRHDGDPELIRTLLAIDEEAKSITFAGDVPEGYLARLMKPDIDALIDGAKFAAEEISNINNDTALGLVVSCTGRKIVMSQLVEEELEVIEEILGEHVQLTGFYSYGELAPFADSAHQCELHNQTMTLTAIYEN